MSGSWSKGALIVVTAGVAVLGAGIWRQGTLARSAKPDVATPPATTTAPAPNATPGATPTASTGKDSKAEFEKMVNGLRARMQAAKDNDEKKNIAEEVLASLQGFAEQHPGDAMADQARLTLGQLQMRMGKPAEAVLTLKTVTETATDKRLIGPARFYMAQALSMAGQQDLAKQTLEDLAKTSPEAEIKKAAQQILDKMNAVASIAPGNRPPSFKAKDLDGREQSPEKYQGQVLLIDFWATWCGPCRAEMPNVKAIHAKYKDQGFTVLGINLDESKDAVTGYLKSQQLSWPQVFDGKGWKNEIAQLYGVTGIPKMLLLDRKGVIRYIDARGPALEAAVAELVAQPAG